MKAITCAADLHALPHWVVFAMVPQPNGKKPRKMPYTPGTDREARVNDPATWGTYAEAVADAKRTGRLLGVTLTPAMNLTLLDKDSHIDDELVERFDSYSERSVNGGLHILVRGRPPEGFVAHSGIEIYPRHGNRFLVLTEDIIDGHDTIADRTELLAQLFPARPKPAPRHGTSSVLDVDDRVIVERVLRMRKGRQLHGDGDMTGHPSGSEADITLLNCYISAGATTAEQLNDLYRSSALYQARQARWDDGRYRERTLTKALNGDVRMWEGWSQQAAEDTVDPCTADRDLIAQLRAEIATLHAELTQARAEGDQARRDLSTVMATLGNPNLGGDAAGKALILAAAEVQHRAHTVPPGDGYVQVNATRIADATVYVDGEPVSAPARISPRTVTKFIGLAAEAGLIPAKKDEIPAPAGKLGLRNEGWYWKAAPTLADQLAPLAAGSVYSDDNPRPLRGGDPTKRRRLKKLPGCPECGGYHVACTDCGVIFDIPAGVDLDSGGTLTAAEVAREQPEDRRHSVPADKDVSVDTVDDVTIADKFVSRDRPHTVPPGKTRRIRAQESLVAWQEQHHSNPETPNASETRRVPLAGLEPPPPDRFAEYAPMGAD